MGKLTEDAGFSVRLMSRHQLAPGIVELKLSRPDGFSFIPGQFVRIHMPGYERDYSLISATEAGTLDLCIRLVDGGRFSDHIRRAVAGDAFHLSGPHGHFVFQDSGHPAVLVATGTGIAPFVAFCRAGLRDALLLHGVRQPADLVYRELLSSGLRSYIPCISQACDVSGLNAAVAGRVTRYLEALLPAGVYDFYLCGRRGMIRDVTALIDRRFGDSRLFIETYD